MKTSVMKIGIKTMEDGIMKKSLFIATALLTLAACSREMNIDTPAGNMTITARTETSADTRTIVKDQVHVYWEPGDEIAVFSGGKSGKFTTDVTEASAAATFHGSLGSTDGADLWAVYPYSKDAVFDGETITTTLPSEQVARFGSFGKNMNLSIAHSDNDNLQFYNVGGGIRFRLTQEGIKKVTFEGYGGEFLSGKVKIGLDENGLPLIREVTDGSKVITLLPPTGNDSFPTNVWFYCVAIPGSLASGFKLEFFRDTEYSRMASEKAVTIKRSIFGNIDNADEGCEFIPIPNTISIPDAVDLGLPSGLKWASFNLGASAPEEWGDYYAWGEIEPYYEPGYAQAENAVWKPGKEDGYSFTSYKWVTKSDLFKLTKYNTFPEIGIDGFTDDKIVLDLEDDAAYMALGGKWRMPTNAAMAELEKGCTWVWISQNGVYGYEVIGPNGNSIFLPACGERWGIDLDILYDLDNPYGAYWSSSCPRYKGPFCAWNLFLYPPDHKVTRTRGYSFGRAHGMAIRPVYGEPVPVESISLNVTVLEISIDEETRLTVNVLPENATFKDVTWSSSDSSVAYVSSDGIVSGFEEGSAIITAMTIDGELVATCQVMVKEDQSSSPVPDAIDLGLPSGLKWASFNLGASKPEEYGDYFAWGETEPKKEYSWDTYVWCAGSEESLLKYCTDSDYGYNGFTDDKTILELPDDAAHVQLGEKWRTPTLDEFQELTENCTWSLATENGITGCWLTSKINGASIFFPAGGSFRDTEIVAVGMGGGFWSSSFDKNNPYAAWGMAFNTVDQLGAGVGADPRCWGYLIRPVYD